MAPPCPIKEHLKKNLLVKSPTRERQVGRGCFGQCSGKEGAGLYHAESSMVWRGPGVGHVGKRKSGRRTFQGGSFAPLSQQNVTRAHLGCVFSKSRICEKGWGLLRDRTS